MSALFEAVQQHVSSWHGGITQYCLQSMTPTIKARYRAGLLRTLDTIGIIYTVGNLQVSDTRVEQNSVIWYVSATLYFHTDSRIIEAITDVYRCCRDGSVWRVRWWAEIEEYQAAAATTGPLAV